MSVKWPWNIWVKVSCIKSKIHQSANLEYSWSVLHGPLQWRHNWLDGVTGLCEGNSPVAEEFPASNAEKVSIWWRHHAIWYDKQLSVTHPHIATTNHELRTTMIIHNNQCFYHYSYHISTHKAAMTARKFLQITVFSNNAWPLMIERAITEYVLRGMINANCAVIWL